MQTISTKLARLSGAGIRRRPSFLLEATGRSFSSRSQDPSQIISSPITHSLSYQKPIPTSNMVAIVRLGLVLLASALTAQACTYCQCKFQDSSHCCVYSVSSHNPASPLTRKEKKRKKKKEKNPLRTDKSVYAHHTTGCRARQPRLQQNLLRRPPRRRREQRRRHRGHGLQRWREL